MNERQPHQSNCLPSKNLAEHRPLTQHERSLVKWLVNHGTREAKQLLPSVSDLRVTGRCQCGCASINFGETTREKEFKLLADHAWKTKQGHWCGCFLFARGDRLAGLEVWSIDGAETPTSLPLPEQLVPLEDIGQ